MLGCKVHTQMKTMKMTIWRSRRRRRRREKYQKQLTLNIGFRQALLEERPDKEQNWQDYRNPFGIDNSGKVVLVPWTKEIQTEE